MHVSPIALAALLGLATIPTAAADAPPPPQCAEDARAQAHKLLGFHFGEDDLVTIGDEVTERAPLRNPKNARQQFTVLEVWGSIYKGEYRMRLIYFRTDDRCVLMGQEILQYATL